MVKPQKVPLRTETASGGIIMEKIASFTVNHLDLLPGIYVSRRDTCGEQALTTFDLRFTRPNLEPVMDTAAVHALEHLGATFLRNHPVWAEKTVYFGPMGCRTGFYVIFKGELQPAEIAGAMGEMCRFVQDFSGEIPGASPRDCGNYLDMNLSMAQYYAAKFRREVLDCRCEKNTVYPA